MKERSPYDRNDLKIAKNDRVLEVGPGHNPAFRSNVIVEKFIDTNAHRCGDVKIYSHQTFVNADGETLPFGNREFDYVICNQVLEHTENPEQFVAEQCRVAKRGYMETPSLIGEFLFPKKSHRWAILDIDGKLVMYEKSRMPGNFENDYGELFLNYLPYQSLPFKLLGLTEGDLMLNRYEWKESIDLIVNPQDDYYQAFFTRKWTREMVEKIFPPRSVKNECLKTWKALNYLLRDKFHAKFGRHASLLTLGEYRDLK